MARTYTVHGHMERRDGRQEAFWTRTGLSKSAAQKLAREQRTESGGVARVVAEEGRAYEASPSRHHATKKSPTQLQREIDEALAKPMTASKETSVLPPSVRVARAGLENIKQGTNNLRYGLYRVAGDRMYQWGNFTGIGPGMDVITAVVPSDKNTASQEALIRALKWKR